MGEKATCLLPGTSRADHGIGSSELCDLRRAGDRLLASSGLFSRSISTMGCAAFRIAWYQQFGCPDFFFNDLGRNPCPRSLCRSGLAQWHLVTTAFLGFRGDTLH